VTILGRSSGTFNTTTAISVTPSGAAFGTGTVIVVAIFGNTVVTTPGGATQRTTSVVDLGLYSYDIAGAAQTSIAFTATAAGSGEWFCWELSAGSTWLSGSATQNAAASTIFTTGTVTPTAGNCHMLMVIGGVGGGVARTVDILTDSFTEFADAQVAAQDWPFSDGSDRDLVADGITGYAPTGTFSGATNAARGGILLAYVNPAAAGPVAKQIIIRRQAINRSNTY
jgi:hypothetical protein